MTPTTKTATRLALGLAVVLTVMAGLAAADPTSAPTTDPTLPATGNCNVVWVAGGVPPQPMVDPSCIGSVFDNAP